MPDLRTRRAPLRVATYPRRVRDLLRTTGPVASPQRVRVPAPLPRPRRGGLAPRLPAAGGTQSLDPRPALSPTLTRLESLRPRTTRGPKGVLVNGFRHLPTDRRSIAGVVMGFVPEGHGSWMMGKAPGEGTKGWPSRRSARRRTRPDLPQFLVEGDRTNDVGDLDAYQRPHSLAVGTQGFRAP